MYESHRSITDRAEVYQLGQEVPEGPENKQEGVESEWEYADDSGQRSLMTPKTKSKGKFPPGPDESARRGDVSKFTPRSKAKGKDRKGPRLRRGGIIGIENGRNIGKRY